MFDFFERHCPVHRVFIEWIAIEIDNLGTRQHHPIVMRFVAVAVHQNNITGPDNGLHNDLVAGRCAIGGKERLFGPERTACQLLCLFDRPVWLQQAVEPSRRRRCFGKKDIGSIERAHILNPM